MGPSRVAIATALVAATWTLASASAAPSPSSGCAHLLAVLRGAAGATASSTPAGVLVHADAAVLDACASLPRTVDVDMVTSTLTSTSEMDMTGMLTRIVANLFFGAPHAMPPSARLVSDFAANADTVRAGLSGFLFGSTPPHELETALPSLDDEPPLQSVLAAAERLLDAVFWRRTDHVWARAAVAANASAGDPEAAASRASDLQYAFAAIRAVGMSYREREMEAVGELARTPQIQPFLSGLIPQGLSDLNSRLAKDGLLVPVTRPPAPAKKGKGKGKGKGAKKDKKQEAEEENVPTMGEFLNSYTPPANAAPGAGSEGSGVGSAGAPSLVSYDLKSGSGEEQATDSDEL
jgi:hypothetical protein